jgi:polysaccharide deacetylase family protein (PEP-CTERM system associated)
MNVLTFDLEEWFHILDSEHTHSDDQWTKFESRIEENLPGLLELLDRTQQPATFFCLGWIARKYPGVIREIDRMGHEIATHSDMHQLVYSQSPDQFRSDLMRSVKSLEDLTGKKVTAYRAPGFSITEKTPWAFDVLMECGIEIDCSVFTSARAHGGFDGFPMKTPCLIERNGARIKEFPLSHFKLGPLRIVFSGGGYFRIMPYPLIRHMMKRSTYVMVYLHYRDFDYGQGTIDGLPLYRRFKSYVGIRGALAKLSRLILEFRFVDVRTANSLVDWEEAGTVCL